VKQKLSICRDNPRLDGERLPLTEQTYGCFVTPAALQEAYSCCFGSAAHVPSLSCQSFNPPLQLSCLAHAAHAVANQSPCRRIVVPVISLGRTPALETPALAHMCCLRSQTSLSAAMTEALSLHYLAQQVHHTQGLVRLLPSRAVPPGQDQRRRSLSASLHY
jgi:hypothetical protein